MAALDTGTEDLLADLDAGILTLTLNRPQARNALTFAMYERLAEICTLANRDETLRAKLEAFRAKQTEAARAMTRELK